MSDRSRGRSRARRRALDVLFESDLRSVSALDVIVVHEEQIGSTPMNPYVRTLVEGVYAHQERIDELLETYSRGWTLARMPTVDRNVLRIGAWEILWGDVPGAVAITEAVSMVNELSTDESAPFVNGLLGQLADIKPRLALD
jgi:N utilization substance protein B